MQLVRQAFPDRPAYDTAVSRAILERVARGELPETFRLARPGAMVAFGKQDVNSPGYTDAVTAAYAGGFEAVQRLAGGRAAVFHEHTIAFAWAGRAQDTWSGTHERFRTIAGIVERALQAPRRRRPHRRDPARVLPRRVQHQRPRPDEARRDRPAPDQGRLAHRRRDRGGRGRSRARRPDPGVRGAGPGLGPGHRGRRRRRGPGRRLGGRGRGAARRAPATTSPPTSTRRRWRSRSAWSPST